ncbi:MAG: hypothetical protein JWQ02_3897 [Capsulimonas sp.]|nr:hypothetical protein [Capsulimonas sp.]
MNKINRAAPECSLYGFLATEAPVCVFLRQGPSKHVQLIKWNTEDDTFELGQWFKGRIYENRCDLSPDGTIFLYWARKENVRPAWKFQTYWGAVSKPPYFTALALWIGNMLEPGSFFLTNTLLSNASCFDNAAHGLTPDKGEFPNDWKFIHDYHGRYVSTCVQSAKRDGWLKAPTDEFYEKQLSTDPDIFLRKKLSADAAGRGYQHQVRTNTETFPIERADWADIDQRGRLVFTRDGKVFACVSIKTGLDSAIELADFNDSKFEPMEAPEWAKAW